LEVSGESGVNIINDLTVDRVGSSWYDTDISLNPLKSFTIQSGIPVVYDDNNVRFEHREELREIARRLGAEDVVIYLNTPLELIREREATNRETGERHEVEPTNFQTVLEQLEPPMSKENVLEFKPNTNVEEFLDKLG